MSWISHPPTKLLCVALLCGWWVVLTCCVPAVLHSSTAKVVAVETVAANLPPSIALVDKTSSESSLRITQLAWQFTACSRAAWSMGKRLGQENQLHAMRPDIGVLPAQLELSTVLRL